MSNPRDFKPMPVKRAAVPAFTTPAIIATAVALAVIAMAIVWRFSPWVHQYFYGDDLAYLLSVRHGSCATDFSEILTATCQERFRPVASAFVIAMVHLFDAQMKYYNFVNFSLQFINAALVFACARRLSGGQVLVSAVIALMVGTSRFALFHTTQAIGPVESLTLAAALACVYCTLRFDDSSRNSLRWAFGALTLAFVAINTHERFVVLAAWLALAFLSSPTARNQSWRFISILLLTCIALPVSYIAYKTIALDTTFMVGTSATHIQFDYERIIEFAGNSSRSIFGFNSGPAYLVGSQPVAGFNAPTVLGWIFVASWVALLVIGVDQVRRRYAIRSIAFLDALRWPVLLMTLASFTLFPALLTIRLEQRWLLAPFAFIVLIAAWAAGRVSDKKRFVMAGLVCVLGLSSVAIDSVAMRDFNRIFLIFSAQFADVAKHDIIDTAPGSSDPIRLVADMNHCDWSLLNGQFFGVYGDAIRPVECFASVDEATRNGLPPNVDLYSYSQGKLINLTDKVGSMAFAGDKDHAIAFDFRANFSAGKINDTRVVGTPTGQGVMMLPWDSRLGNQKTLIILSGFAYRFEDISIPPGSTLHFGTSMIFPAPQSARLVVTAAANGSDVKKLLSLDLNPPQPDQVLDFQPISIDLTKFAGDKVTIEFSVQSPGGDSTAQWVGLVRPLIIANTKLSSDTDNSTHE